MTTVLTLVSKPDCHLCDDARAVIDDVLSSAALGGSVEREEVSILDDPALYDRFWEEIPVVLINGRVHNYWRIDPNRLRRALEDAS